MIPSLFFTCDIAHSLNLSAVLQRHGVKAYPLSGKTPEAERRRLVRLFREGSIDGLTSCSVLNEGADFPVAMGGFMCSPTKSDLLFRQRIGRLLRPHPTPQGERQYQFELLKSIALNLDRGVINQIAVLATGLGKTYSSSLLPPLLRSWKRGKPRGRLLFCVHLDELANQAADSFAINNPSLKVGIEKAGSYAGDADIVIGSVQTLGPNKNGDGLYSFNDRLTALNPSQFDAVVVDECHHATGKFYCNVLRRMQALKGEPERDSGILHLGISATPQRHDQIGLERHYDEIVFNYGIREGIRDKWLVPITCHRVETHVDISEVTTRGSDFSVGQLESAIDTPVRNEIVAQKYLEICELEHMTAPLSNIGLWQKQRAVIVDFCDLTGHHSIVTTSTLFGLRSSFNPKGKDLVAQVEEIERIEQEHPTLNLRDAPNMEAIHATLQSVDLLAAPNVPPEIAKYSKFGWLSDGPGAYHMGLMDHRVLTVRENTLGQWEVYEHSRGLASHLWTTKTMKEALALAERQIPRKDAPVLRVGAKWQGDPPSDRQASRIWQVDQRVRKHYPTPSQFYDFCRTQYQSGNESYSKGGLSRTLTALEKV
jgi:superfamily II DNA or RNA helicase